MLQGCGPNSFSFFILNAFHDVHPSEPCLPIRLKTSLGTSSSPLDVRFNEPDALACLKSFCSDTDDPVATATSPPAPKAEEGCLPPLPLPIAVARMACTTLRLSSTPLPLPPPRRRVPLPVDDMPSIAVVAEMLKPVLVLMFCNARCCKTICDCSTRSMVCVNVSLG